MGVKLIEVPKDVIDLCGQEEVVDGVGELGALGYASRGDFLEYGEFDLRRECSEGHFRH